MIRNVVTGRLTGGATEAHHAQLETALAGIAALDLPGLLSMSTGLDLGLRDGGWTFAIVNDWVDEDAYRHYDLDEEHNVHRSAIVQVCSAISRVQFRFDPLD